MALIYKKLPGFGLVEMTVFIVSLVVGLVNACGGRSLNGFNHRAQTPNIITTTLDQVCNWLGRIALVAWLRNRLFAPSR